MGKLKVFLGMSFLFAAAAIAVPVVGQKAEYALDKDPKRTLSMVKSGTMTVSLAEFLPGAPQGPMYEMDFEYRFQVNFLGTYEGMEKMHLDEAFFTAQFLEDLRKNGHYSGAYFKADHKGYADAKNLDGKIYPHCDKVLLYELRDSSAIQGMLSGLLGIDRAEIKNAKFLLHLSPGIPALGSAKIDVTGVSHGTNFKVGGDYISH